MVTFLKHTQDAGHKFPPSIRLPSFIDSKMAMIRRERMPSSKRKIALMVFSMLTVGSGFAPLIAPHCTSSSLSRQSPLTEPSSFTALHSTPITNSKKQSGRSKRYDEFQWLNWVYNQWQACACGEIPEPLVRQMIPAISKWGRRKSLNSAERAEELLHRLVEEAIAGNGHVDLTVALFNAAMDAHAKGANPEGVQRILRKMETLRVEHEQFSNLRPDVVTMSTLTTAWAKSRLPEAASKSVAVLQYMEDQGLEPNTIVYNAVLHALAFSPRMDKSIKAEELVECMKSQYAEGKDCKPDIYTYQSLILAWSRTNIDGAPQKAEKILNFLDEEAKNGNKSLTPNAHCFTSIIHAYARSNEPQKAHRAYQVLTQMKKLSEESGGKNAKPNVVAFTAVINACNRPIDESEKEDAFQIAQLTMKEVLLGRFERPNFLTFATFLGVCSSTLTPSIQRDYIVMKTFEQCCEAGQVGQIVLEKLKLAASQPLYNDLLEDVLNEDGVPELPFEWTANIRGERNVEPRRAENKITPWHLPRSPKLRLKIVQQYGDDEESSSNHETELPRENEIQWTTDELSDRRHILNEP